MDICTLTGASDMVHFFKGAVRYASCGELGFTSRQFCVRDVKSLG